MAIFIKISLAILFLILGMGLFFLTSDYISTIKQDEHKNNSLLAKFFTHVIWLSVSACLLAFEFSLIFSIFSSITIN